MKQIFATSPFNTLLNLTLDDVGDGTARVSVALRADHLNPLGIAHGGLIATGLDCALLQAVRSRCGPDDQQTTVEMKVNYLEAVKSQRLDFKANVVRLGRRLGVAQAEARDASDKVVAIAIGTIAVHKPKA